MNHTTNNLFNQYSPVFRPAQQHQTGFFPLTQKSSEPLEIQKKKKKCHGDLKLQRIHRRQRKQQLKTDHMECSVDEHDTLTLTTEIQSRSSDTDNRRMNTDTISKPTEVRLLKRWKTLTYVFFLYL